MSERSRGVMVYPMPEEVGGPAVLGVYALLTRPDDPTVVMMVHSEGVGYKVTDEKPWCWTDYDPNQHRWVRTDLLEIARHIQPVDLADWVRTHNDRLESNFHQIWWWATEDDRQEAEAEMDAEWRDVEAGEQHLRDTNRD